MGFDKVREVIADHLGIDQEEITMDSYFVDDLGADSIDLMELIVSFETMFDIEVTDEALENVKQVKDIVEYIENNNISL